MDLLEQYPRGLAHIRERREATAKPLPNRNNTNPTILDLPPALRPISDPNPSLDAGHGYSTTTSGPIPNAYPVVVNTPLDRAYLAPSPEPLYDTEFYDSGAVIDDERSRRARACVL